MSHADIHPGNIYIATSDGKLKATLLDLESLVALGDDVDKKSPIKWREALNSEKADATMDRMSVLAIFTFLAFIHTLYAAFLVGLCLQCCVTC
jgi:predicted unusual protein kinase regulating ubiquinone biosynthesis (AarF/ABC1/UbiB family)